MANGEWCETSYELRVTSYKFRELIMLNGPRAPDHGRRHSLIATRHSLLALHPSSFILHPSSPSPSSPSTGGGVSPQSHRRPPAAFALRATAWRARQPSPGHRVPPA